MMNSIKLKKLMALAGVFWFIYLCFHMAVNLNFVVNPERFNAFYHWFNETTLLRYGLITALGGGLFFHVFYGVRRQLDSNNKRLMPYKKKYPHAIPRLVAWSGASLLFGFIVFHFVQMQWLRPENDIQPYDFYQSIDALFAQPLMWLIYGLGLFALTAHLHHALSNVGQSLGLSHRKYHGWVVLILFILIGGFILVPISTLF